ncbi:MAG: hypothetical protein ACP5T2_05015, partial [Thermoprotei archaeon]
MKRSKALAFIALLLCELPVISSASAVGAGTSPAQPYTSVYWLKLGGWSGGSEVIYMGFASPSANLFNGKNVGEAPNLSAHYGQYDDGASVFDFYTNFTSAEGLVINLSKGSYSLRDGLHVNFNGPGYVVSSRQFGPGTEFFAYLTYTGDVDNVGYINTREFLSVGNWAGAFIRQACVYTYPDQWNASGEANGCGSQFGYFVKREGVPGVYGVEVINRTTSAQYLNGNWSRPVDAYYPSYPASVGFSGVYSPLGVQWAFVATAPPGGREPAVSASPIAYPASSLSSPHVPDILYVVPITISPSVSTPFDLQVTVNSSLYSKYEAPNLQNVEFFYSNGTVIPSWLEFRASLAGLAFHESGLPSGDSWSVTLNGTTRSSTSPNITFQEPAGTYSYSVSVPSGLSASPSSGTITVSSYQLSVPVTVSAISMLPLFGAVFAI